MRAYLFALEIDPIKIGVMYKTWPLRCTLMHWFRTSAGPDEIFRITREIFDRHSPIELISEAPAIFGRNHNVPVHTIRPNTGLSSLHADLLSTLNALDVSHAEPEFVGAGYKPHVSTQGDHAFLPGMRAVALYAYLVEALDAENFRDKIARFKIALGD